MLPAINSILDQDFYKFTVSQFIFEHYYDALVEYRYTARNFGYEKFNPEFVGLLKDQLVAVSKLKLTDEEYEYMSNVGVFKPAYLAFLKTFQYDPDLVTISVDGDGFLKNIIIAGPVLQAQMWEVLLLALISELYFTFVDKNWTMVGQAEQAKKKIIQLNSLCLPIGATWMEFGTRRRRNYDTQDLFIKNLVAYKPEENNGIPNVCSGTSNVHFAMKYHIPVLGTVGHEAIMLVSGIEGVKCANRVMVDKWQETYGEKLSVALPDTFRSEDFFKLNDNYAFNIGGVRQDSGDPKKFAEAAMKWFGPNYIKKIIFSDGLNIKSCRDIVDFMMDKPKNFKVAFGLGTFLTNDFAGSPPINHVIKLHKVNDTYVVKLSDSPGKETGDKMAVKAAKYDLYQEPLE